MGDLIRNHPAMAGILILGWLTYGPYSTEPPQAKGATKPQVISQENLTTRPAGLRAVSIRSPFQPELEPPEPGRSDDLPAAGMWLVNPVESALGAYQVTHPGAGPLHVLATLVSRGFVPGGSAVELAFQTQRSVGGSIALPGNGDIPEFSLALESMLAFGGGNGRARISGQDVLVGEELYGFDPVSPPRLLEVQGLTVVVEHRGEEVVLDLDRNRTALFGPNVKRP
jgi:hypothetical protein